MDCTKLEDFNKENPNYQILIDSIENGGIQLLEDECKAVIFSSNFQDFNILGQMKFIGGMNNYLAENGYSIEIT